MIVPYTEMFSMWFELLIMQNEVGLIKIWKKRGTSYMFISLFLVYDEYVCQANEFIWGKNVIQTRWGREEIKK